ncbi:MAG TPA: hypothetical protein VFS56_04380, partial [Gemmatimonadaceae bacterium]|nr:hypothetical protein [Gemmatimonadaceae bacterium]
MPSLERWKATWPELGVPITAALLSAYDDLIARYCEPHRKYHTVRHLDECFTKLEEIRALAERPGEVEAALWFHDAIYETRSSQNEAKSADLAAEVVRNAGKPSDSVERISDLI